MSAVIRRLNHAVLYVRDARRSADFYREALGFEVVTEAAGGAEQEQHGRPELEFLAGDRGHAQTARTVARGVAVRRLMRRGQRVAHRHRRAGRA